METRIYATPAVKGLRYNIKMSKILLLDAGFEGRGRFCIFRPISGNFKEFGKT